VVHTTSALSCVHHPKDLLYNSLFLLPTLCPTLRRTIYSALGYAKMCEFLADSPILGPLDDASHDVLTYQEDAALDALDYFVDQEAIFSTLPPSESDDIISEPLPSALAPQRFATFEGLEAYIRAEASAMGFGITVRTSTTEKVDAPSQLAESGAAGSLSTVLVRVNGYFHCQFYGDGERSAHRRARPEDAFCDVDEKGQPLRLCTWRVRWSRRGGVWGLTNPRQFRDEPHRGHTMRRPQDTHILQRLGDVPRSAYAELQKWIQLRLPKASIIKVHRCPPLAPDMTMHLILHNIISALLCFHV
jgi:hypothetical protein